MSGQFVGVDPEYQMPSREPQGELSEAAQRVLENEQLCRRQLPERDWRGDLVEQAAPVKKAPAKKASAKKAAPSDGADDDTPKED